METILEALLNSVAPAAGGAAGDGPPAFIHLVPAGTFSGADGRGPFTLASAASVIAASLKDGKKLPVDINHSIDLLAGTGKAAPAVGWIVAMETRDDGIWGAVEWTSEGQRIFAAREYGFISPVFNATASSPHRVVQILRASLTNDPNLDLKSLHARTHGGPAMDEELRKALGLPETASQADILAAVTRSLNAATALAEIVTAAGLNDGATSDEVVTALQSRGAADTPEVAELRGQVKELNTRLTAAVTETARTRAETVVNQAIADGRLVPALRDRFIARHMKEPADVEAEIKLMPQLNAGGLGNRRQIDVPDGNALTGSDATVVEMMGLDPKAYAETSAKLQKEML